MTRTRLERRAAAARRPREGKTRAELHAPLRKTPTKRGVRGAQKVGRHGTEQGVTSRARKSRTGHETVPDPRYGGRPGRRKSKWSPLRDLHLRETLRSARERARRPSWAEHRVHVLMDRALYEKMDRIVHAERIRAASGRVTMGRLIADVLRGYRPGRETEAVMRRLARAGRETV